MRGNVDAAVFFAASADLTVALDDRVALPHRIVGALEALRDVHGVACSSTSRTAPLPSWPCVARSSYRRCPPTSCGSSRRRPCALMLEKPTKKRSDSRL
jgi:hypothetical protein